MIVAAYAVLTVLAGLAVFTDRQATRRFDAEQLRRAAVQSRPIDRLQMEGKTFREAAAELEQIAGVTITLDGPRLMAAGVAPDDPVYLTLFDLPLHRMLELLLDQAGGTTKLAWAWEGDGIVVSTAEELMAKAAVIRAYDLRNIDLTQAPPVSSPTVCFSMPSTSSGRGGGNGLFPRVLVLPDPGERFDPRLHPICDIIRDTVEPAIWRYNGGRGGDLQLVDGRLMVTAPPAVQRQVQTIFGYLRDPGNE
jgi:hypothetical protein